jgi:hypothetical protein
MILLSCVAFSKSTWKSESSNPDLLRHVKFDIFETTNLKQLSFFLRHRQGNFMRDFRQHRFPRLTIVNLGAALLQCQKSKMMMMMMMMSMNVVRARTCLSGSTSWHMSRVCRPKRSRCSSLFLPRCWYIPRTPALPCPPARPFYGLI